MRHFFVKREQISDDGLAVITGKDVNHIRSVLRMRPGDRILISDGDRGRYLCRLRELGPDRVTAEIISEAEEGAELASELVLFQGLPKGDKMDWIVQKSVELGVRRIVPVRTRRCVARLDGEKAEVRVRRWNAIAESAAKQSGRLAVPEVAPVASWKEALALGAGLDVRILPYENVRGMGTVREAAKRVKPGVSAGVLIGPEGGFEEQEVREAREAGFVPVSLGRRILRTETAGFVMMSILMVQAEIQAEMQEETQSGTPGRFGAGPGEGAAPRAPGEENPA